MSSETNSDKKESGAVMAFWKRFKGNHPVLAQFIVFFILSNGVTVLQMVLMPLLKSVFEMTSLIHISFQLWPVGQNFDNSIYYIFNYAAGPLGEGGGGGLAYFMAVQMTLAIAQVINFFAQRNITFKSNSNIWKAAFWYLFAYVVITITAAALQGIYKAPIYNLLINHWGLESLGETIADVITMFIYAAISFWVFFPIFRIIFKNRTNKERQKKEKRS